MALAGVVAYADKEAPSGMAPEIAVTSTIFQAKDWYIVRDVSGYVFHILPAGDGAEFGNPAKAVYHVFGADDEASKRLIDVAQHNPNHVWTVPELRIAAGGTADDIRDNWPETRLDPADGPLIGCYQTIAGYDHNATSEAFANVASLPTV